MKFRDNNHVMPIVSWEPLSISLSNSHMTLLGKAFDHSQFTGNKLQTEKVPCLGHRVAKCQKHKGNSLVSESVSSPSTYTSPCYDLQFISLGCFTNY